MSGPGTAGRPAGGVLVLNAGSSSLKAEIRTVRLGRVETPMARAAADCAAGEHAAATAAVVAELARQMGGATALSTAITAVGHRIVNGGTRLRATTRIDADVVEVIERLAPLAPLHNPAALDVIRASARLLPAG
jgi:acetate kinase